MHSYYKTVAVILAMFLVIIFWLISININDRKEMDINAYIAELRQDWD